MLTAVVVLPVPPLWLKIASCARRRAIACARPCGVARGRRGVAADAARRRDAASDGGGAAGAGARDVVARRVACVGTSAADGVGAPARSIAPEPQRRPPRRGAARGSPRSRRSARCALDADDLRDELDGEALAAASQSTPPVVSPRTLLPWHSCEQKNENPPSRSSIW